MANPPLCSISGKYWVTSNAPYGPPISFDGLARSFRAAVHHSSPMYVKHNILASTFIPHSMLSQQAFSRYALDYLVFGMRF
ncbi:phage-related capsid packaging protein [Yersinia nurmii]|uniref:Phage-related capsid packaging protein n=1 Tax=Yersinia nurmii TaxID=685706 RepID=A0ABM9S7P0_9GAMM|nr:phage-related capsid packaging protein [Yersinia nurmii]